MKKMFLRISAVGLMLIGINFTSSTYAGEELHVCPGSGESCEATITFEGKDVKVSSFKTKGSGTIVVIAP
ncbi:hypothetical protein LZF95_18540 [Algoriphagus sp. AGSA1]|uniref:hypothetical protein n=1 Tax=Algoriphagus sp. AGSA1 TaxID=2907213 RepID=UPI001F246739|nr:hypothetical protein [Algoriphagus sp. AGSA1]MCE7056690.1 hypothetical protein [Algoriphagus sp. AGSA1]